MSGSSCYVEPSGRQWRRLPSLGRSLTSEPGATHRTEEVAEQSSSKITAARSSRYLALNLARTRVRCRLLWSLAGNTNGVAGWWEARRGIAVTRAPAKRKTPLSLVDNGGQDKRVMGFEPTTSTLATCGWYVLNRELQKSYGTGQVTLHCCFLEDDEVVQRTQQGVARCDLRTHRSDPGGVITALMGTKSKLGGLMHVDAVCLGSRSQPRCRRQVRLSDATFDRRPDKFRVVGKGHPGRRGAAGNHAWLAFGDPPSIARGGERADASTSQVWGLRCTHTLSPRGPSVDTRYVSFTVSAWSAEAMVDSGLTIG